MDCLCCGASDGVELESSRTAYSRPALTRWDRILEETPPDPNAPIPLCRPCAETHHAEWDAVWREYYSGLL